MPHHADHLLPPRILIVDDERQIHSSLRLRIGRDYSLTFHADPRQALTAVTDEQFDLCIVDIHMPHMNGLAFVEAARKIDANLGYIILSAFDTDDNLRRAIPLQVYDFISKPLPERDGFEARIPEWISRTRECRRHQRLAVKADALASELHAAKLERDVELVASETARDALLQTANLLTTIHAHLVTATAAFAIRSRPEPGVSHLQRNLEEARRTADAAVAVAEGFFNSAYGNRDTSPALLHSGVSHAASIATRMTGAEEAGKRIDFGSLDDRLPLRGISGIEFLLMMVPALGAALSLARPNTTVRIEGCHVARHDHALRDTRLKRQLWVNRRNAPMSQPGILLTIAAAGEPLSRVETEGWLKGESTRLATISARGLVLGVQKHKALLGLGVTPEVDQFLFALVLPT